MQGKVYEKGMAYSAGTCQKKAQQKKTKWYLHLNCGFNTGKNMKAVSFSKETEWLLTPTACKPACCLVPLKRSVA